MHPTCLSLSLSRIQLNNWIIFQCSKHAKAFLKLNMLCARLFFIWIIDVSEFGIFLLTQSVVGIFSHSLTRFDSRLSFQCQNNHIFNCFIVPFIDIVLNCQVLCWILKLCRVVCKCNRNHVFRTMFSFFVCFSLSPANHLSICLSVCVSPLLSLAPNLVLSFTRRFNPERTCSILLLDFINSW